MTTKTPTHVRIKLNGVTVEQLKEHADYLDSEVVYEVTYAPKGSNALFVRSVSGDVVILFKCPDVFSGGYMQCPHLPNGAYWEAVEGTEA